MYRQKDEKYIMKKYFQGEKPDKKIAEALLEYIAMENCKPKEIIEILCGSEIEKYFKWIDNYCKENTCTQEEILSQIMKG